MEYYLSTSIGSTLIRSPFRKDDNPTCGFYYSKKGRLYLHDFGTGTHYDCIEIVKQKFNISFRQAIEKIYSDRSKFKYSGNIIKRTDKFYEFLFGDIKTYSYFYKFGIKIDTLIKYRVHPVKTVYLDQTAIARTTNENPIFAYVLPSGNIKFYRPLSKEKGSKKWFGNCVSTDVFGLEQIPKRGQLLIITSSLKDVMVLHEMGYNAIAFNGEGYGAGKHETEVDRIIEDLKRRYQYVVFYMDNDPAGINYNKTLAFKFRCKYIHNQVHQPKDISDYVKIKSFYAGKRNIKKLLSRIFRISEDTGFHIFAQTCSDTNTNTASNSTARRNV